MPHSHPSTHASKRKPDPSQIHSDESHIGGTLEELSERGGTTIPKNAGTQNIVKPKLHPHVNKALRAYPLRADNRIGMPESPQDMGGATGEVVTAMGYLMPAGIEEKNLGSTGGKKHNKYKRHTKKAMAGM